MPEEKEKTADLKAEFETGTPSMSAKVDVVSAISPLHIARYLLEMSDKDPDIEGLTPIHLNKLTYITHGYHLGFLDSPLITNGEYPQAWKYGPVYKSIYDSFCIHGDGLVPHTHFRNNDYKLDKNDLDPETTTEVIKAVWDTHASVEGGKLITLTHEKGTPWHTVWTKMGGRYGRGVPIHDDITYAYYYDKVKKYRENESDV